MSDAEIIFTNIGVSFLLFMVNVVRRSNRNRPQSTGADAILVLIALDITAILGSSTLAPLSTSADFADYFLSAHLMFLLTGFIFWDLALKRSERAIDECYDVYFRGDGSDSPVEFRLKKGGYWLLGWMFFALVLSIHISYYWRLVSSGE